MNPIKFTNINNLYLDPNNPRLGRHTIEKQLTQEKLLEKMRAWTLEELAYSYLESGEFWTHEALLVIKENKNLIVVEGNRRLAALKYLYEAYRGNPFSQKWQKLIEECPSPSDTLFTEIPYILKNSRQEVFAFLGFRHVTGIKEWRADEKATFIAKLIDEEGLTYDQVRRKIGSKTPTVRQHYIAHRLLLQMENYVEDFNPEKAGRRFSLLYATLRNEATKQYLQINTIANPDLVKEPVPLTHLKNLANFTRWLFGTKTIEPLVTTDRNIDKFGKILESKEAITYLETRSKPKFELAFNIAGGDEDEIIRYIEEAADNIQLALTRVHRYKKSPKLQESVTNLGRDALQLLDIFSDIKRELLEDET